MSTRWLCQRRPLPSDLAFYAWIHVGPHGRDNDWPTNQLSGLKRSEQCQDPIVTKLTAFRPTAPTESLSPCRRGAPSPGCPILSKWAVQAIFLRVRGAPGKPAKWRSCKRVLLACFFRLSPILLYVQFHPTYGLYQKVESFLNLKSFFFIFFYGLTYLT